MMEILVFGVEMMPEYYPYAVLACAVSPMDGTHGSPLGPSTSLRILGSSYLSATLGWHTSLSDITSRTIALAYVKREDRAGSRTRFLDTMALNVAVTGISSHQCSVWMRRRRSKLKERELAAEAICSPGRDQIMPSCSTRWNQEERASCHA